MRRSRSRRGKGLRCYMLELRDAEIIALVRRGLLASDEERNPAAVRKAMYAFFDLYLGSAVSRVTEPPVTRNSALKGPNNKIQ